MEKGFKVFDQALFLYTTVSCLCERFSFKSESFLIGIEFYYNHNTTFSTHSMRIGEKVRVCSCSRPTHQWQLQMNENAVSTVTVSLIRVIRAWGDVVTEGYHARQCANVRASKTSKRAKAAQCCSNVRYCRCFIRAHLGGHGVGITQGYGWGGVSLDCTSLAQARLGISLAHTSISGPRHGRTVRVGNIDVYKHRCLYCIHACIHRWLYCIHACIHRWLGSGDD